MFTENIKKIYKIKEEESPIGGSSIIIIFILLIIGYVYLKVSQSQIALDWKNQKCNPRYLFFSYYMNPLHGQDPYKITQNNFLQCVKPHISVVNSNIYNEIKETTNNIGKTTNSIEKYADTINIELNKRLEKWSKNHKELDTSANKLEVIIDNEFKNNKDIYNILLISSQRVFSVIDTIARYTKDVLLYKISTNKKNFTIQDENLFNTINTNLYNSINSEYKNKSIEGKNVPNISMNDFKRYIDITYESIYNNEYNNSFNLLERPNSSNYSGAINNANKSISTYRLLMAQMDMFDVQNGTLVDDTVSKCNQIRQFNDSCNNILPNWTYSP